MSHDSSDTLFHKYGGFATVGNIVHSFYEKVMEQKHLVPYFAGVDMDLLMSRQTEFMCQLLDGPVSYNGQTGDLRSTHARLKISDEDFETMADLLEEAFEDAGFEDADLETVMGRVMAAKDQITSRGED